MNWFTPKKQVHPTLEAILVSKFRDEYSEAVIKKSASELVNSVHGPDVTLGQVLKMNSRNENPWRR